jgi:hypothetical protein
MKILSLFLAIALPLSASAQIGLTWITNSSVKLEQVIGEMDWATGSNTVSQTITRFNIEGTDISSSFISGTNRIFIFGDTIGLGVSYNADPVAWSTTTNGEQGLLLNLFTYPNGSNVFGQPQGIDMSGDDTPNAGICISNVNYLICNTKARERLFRAGHVQPGQPDLPDQSHHLGRHQWGPFYY